MLSEVKIMRNLTKSKFGYDSLRLNMGSHNRVVVKCTGCGEVYEKEYRDIHRRHSCPIIRGNKKRCDRCKKWKLLNEFTTSSKRPGGRAKVCRKCFNNFPCVKKYEKNRLKRFKHAIQNSDYMFYIKRYIGRQRSRANKLGVAFNLDLNYLIELWENQQGRCYYTNIPITGVATSKFPIWNCPSLDRKNSNKGYIKGNVVWCLFCINSFKGSLTVGEFSKMIKKINWWNKVNGKEVN